MECKQDMTRRISRAVLSLVVLIAAWPASALTLVSAAGTLNKAGETYRLTSNIVANGTAFTISANGVVLDLNGYTVTYNNGAGASAHGVSIQANNVKVGNGSIVQGTQKSTDSHAIMADGSDGEFHHLAISVTGPETYGVYVTSGARTAVHHVFVSSTAPSNSTGDPPTGIYIQSQDEGGISVNNNIVVGAVRGVTLEFVGQALFPNMPVQSKVFENLLQPDRIYGSKGPYGVLSARSSNVDIYSNQIVSDQARGINLDGYEQGTSSGTTHNLVRNNLIDVQYSPNSRTGNGNYRESDVYGIRDRYGSGENTISGNTIIVNNAAGGDSWGLFIGSDAYEASMKNIAATGNVIIERNGSSTGTYHSDCIALDYGESLSVTGNQYQCAHDFIGFDGLSSSGFRQLTNTGNTALAIPSGAPSAPSGLHGRRLLDKVVIEWTGSASAGTYEYRVYRDGTRISGSDVGGRFFIDTIGSGNPVYTVTAVNLAGQESSSSAPLSLSSTENGWGVVNALVAPNPPTGVTVK